MSVLNKLLVVSLLIVYPQFFANAQCPTSEADLADGGIFSGNCTINVGASIIITGAVIWNSGTLSITGNAGNIDINGGSLTINGGTVQAVDGNNGDLDVINGSVTIAAGATLLLDESIQVFNGASIIVNGTLSSQDNVIDIDAGGIVTVNSTGLIQSGSTGPNADILVQGTLINNNGTVDSNGSITVTGTLSSTGNINAAVDFEVAGGTAIISGGILTTGDDLKVYNGGAFTLGAGATANITDNIVNNVNGNNGGLGSQGLLVINGILSGSGNLTINNTAPNSGLTGTGIIDIGGNYIDNECPGIGDFCGCTGSAIGPCSSALPIELLSFTAFQAGSIIKLKWETATETNNDYFTVQKLNPGDDFKDVKKVKGKGNSKEKSTYLTEDISPDIGKNYYRLKQTDFDGKFSYSKVVLVDYKNAVGTFRMYPNPLRNQDLKLEVDDLVPNEKIKLTIRTIHGVTRFDEIMVSDLNGILRLSFQTSDWPSGIYILQLGKRTEKFVID